MGDSQPARLLGRRSVLRGLLGIGVGGLTGTAAYGYLYERRRIGVTRSELPVAGLPPALAGLRVALATDFHHSETVPLEDVATAVNLVLREQPDLIVLGGDYVTWGDRRFAQPCAEALGPLAAPHGVFAVLGNHDDDRYVPKVLAAQGFEVLKDARTTVRINGEPLDIVGIRFWTRKPSTIAHLVGSHRVTKMLLAHDPRRLEQAAGLRVPVVLSGHTHGGQVVLPVLGAVAARRFPVVEGIARRGDTTIFVSRGVGTVLVPCRLNCPPEVALLTLQPADAGDAAA